MSMELELATKVCQHCLLLKAAVLVCSASCSECLRQETAVVNTVFASFYFRDYNVNSPHLLLFFLYHYFFSVVQRYDLSRENLYTAIHIYIYIYKYW